MATISITGVTPRDLTGYVELFRARFREQFGADFSLDPETPQGQIISVLALSATEIDESIVSLANSLSVDHAVGRELDDLGTLLGIARIPATKSSVTATMSGVAGTHIPAGTIARTAAGDEFAAISDSAIPAALSVAVDMVAVNDGAVVAAAGDLNQVVTIIPGWETITNAAAASVGAPTESDADYRRRYNSVTGRLSIAPKIALKAALVESGVDDARIEENATNAQVTRQGLDIAAYSVMCIVRGGQQPAIAGAILAHKGLGVGMSGSVAHGGARYETYAPAAIKVALEISTTLGLFPADGIAQITQRLVDYADSTFALGEGIDLRRIQTPINSVIGHSITSLAVTLADESALPAVTPLNTLFSLSASDIVITIA